MVKIEGPGPIRPGANLRRKEKAAGAGDFAKNVHDAGDEPASTPVAGVNPLNSIDALLSLQQVGDATSGRGKALRRGEDMLDRLDDLRLGLLMGQVPREKLRQLLELVEQRRNQFEDPRLAEILDDIELRAKVELAKLGEL